MCWDLQVYGEIILVYINLIALLEQMLIPNFYFSVAVSVSYRIAQTLFVDKLRITRHVNFILPRKLPLIFSSPIKTYPLRSLGLLE